MNRHHGTLRKAQFLDDTIVRHGDRDRRLVGHDLDEVVELFDDLANRDFPAHDFAFGDALSDVGKFEFEVRHGTVPFATILSRGPLSPTS